MKMSNELKGWIDQMLESNGDINTRLFAELIVHKCARLCEMLDAEKQDEYATGKECADLIRNYFDLE